MNLVDKSEDESESEAGLHRRARRRKFLLLGGIGTVAVAAVLVAVNPWSDDDAANSASTLADGASPSAAADQLAATEPELSNRLLFDPRPEGFVAQYINDPGSNDQGFDRQSGFTTMDVSLLRAADATLADGPWMSVTVNLLDRFERASFDPMNGGFDASQFRKTKVNGLNGAIGKNWDDTQSLLFGPVNDGFAVSISAMGVPEATLLAIGAEITLEEDGATASPVFGKALIAAGLEPFLRYEAPSWGGVQVGLQLPGLFGDQFSTTVAYSTVDGFGDFLSIMNQPLGAGLDFMELARFALTDTAEVTVHGVAGLVGQVPDNLGGQTMVVWTEGGRLVIVSGSRDADELVALAETVTEASDDDWAQAQAQVAAQQRQNDERSPESWVIGVGDLPDSTTWVIEGAFDSDGDLATCAMTMSNDGSSSSGCGNATPVTAPSIIAGPSIGFSGSAASIIGLGEPGDALVLRYTPTDGDAIEVQFLREIRADWPMWAAAMVPSGPGTAELVDAAGVVVATKEFSEDEFSFDPGDTGGFGIAPAETVAPAEVAAPAG